MKRTRPTAAHGIDRRGFLGALGAGALAMSGAAQAAQRRKRRIPIALQVYSVRQDASRDLSGVLAAVADMGYEGVDFAGFYGHSALSVRKMLDDNGLQVAGAHVQLDLLLGDKFQETVEFHQTIGNRFLIVPGLPKQRRESRQAWLDTAKLFNKLSRKLEPYGMRTGYHNHSVEFTPMDGERPWDTFFGNTLRRVVMQLDMGNALHGGADPALFLVRYRGRATTVHLKEYSETKKDPILGEGDVQWETIFELCETIGNTKWYIVEQERYPHPPLECARMCIENLRAMGK
ncbi:MAG: sugar phosphate isomerase/epimerase [Armatimonadota bacterium]|jgi:sugar phosphate isomerase/epimerase